jgi:hypothetical protein
MRVKLGRFLTKKGRISLFLLAALTPLLLVFFFLLHSFTKLKHMREELVYTHQSALQSFPQRWAKKQFYESFTAPNPSFLSDEVESINLLSEEKKMLEEACKYPLLQNDQAAHKRLQFLQKNRFSFQEEAIRTLGKTRETEERQVNATEVSFTDLQKFLSLVEGIEIPPFTPKESAPQMQFTDFQLESISGKETYLLKSKILKREFSKEKNS